jgi:O-antigen ligase
MIKYKKNITEFFLLLLAFLIPVYKNFVPITILLLLLFWFVNGNYKNKFRGLIKNKTGFIFFGFYILYVTGMLYTSNFPRGIFDLEVKLSLIIFPLIFLSGVEIIEKIDLIKY